MNTYTFEEHIHRYAVWTAARAAQRGFTKTKVIDEVIKEVGLRDYLNNPHTDQTEFDGWHQEMASRMAGAFERRGVECSFGRAAKIIAIYLKTALLLPKGPGAKECLVIHPPIDRILLQNFAKSLKGHAEHSKLRSFFSQKKWTEFTDVEYRDVIKAFRDIRQLDWTIEVYWSGADNSEE
jgi:hypothetical protein